jgi:hypothetical protein
MRRRIFKGGNEVLKAIPVETYGYEYGGSDSENAAKMLDVASDKQNALNNALSGGKRKITKGGSTGIEIPQFPLVGPQVSAQTANSASIELNKVLINATNDATNDSKIETQSGGKRSRKKSRRKIRKSYKKICKSRRCGNFKKRKTKRKYYKL